MSGTNGDKIEVDRGTLARERAMLGILDKAWQSADLGPALRKKFKELEPSIKLPEEDPAYLSLRAENEGLTTKLTALETMFNEYKTGAEAKEAEQGLRRQLGDIQTKFGFSDEAMQDTIKIMQERNLAHDPEAAALLYRERQPKAPLQGGTNFAWEPARANFFGTGSVDEAWEKLHTDQDGFFTDVVNQVMSESFSG